MGSVLPQNDDELAATIQQRGIQPESETRLWACLSRFVNHKDGGPIPQQTIAANAGIFFAAGYETTAHAISWALFELAANPSMQVWTLQHVLIELHRMHTLSCRRLAQAMRVTVMVSWLHCVITATLEKSHA